MTGIAELEPQDVASVELFRKRVVEPCVPVVIRGLAAEWPLTLAAATSAQAAVDLLAAIDTGGPAEAFIGDPAIGGRYHYGEALEGFNFRREATTLSGALQRIVSTAGQPEAPSIYAGSLPIDAYLPGFADTHRPAALPATVRPRIWIGHASTVSCHHDNADNLACVTAGKRRFTLFPPDAIGDLYVGPIDHTMAGQPVSLALGASPAENDYPRLAAAQAQSMVAELGAGDAIYLPKLWWHQVEATAPFNILLNFWWDATASGGDAPYHVMLLAAAAIAGRPSGERQAWRAFYDHYVFQTNGHPLAHLPPERHGILGEGQRGRLRALAMRLLRGA